MFRKISTASEAEFRTLISQVTGIEDESDENFEQCMVFIKSNVKYHTFLSVDSHKIKKSIEGICTKFSVHSQDDKAAELQRLVEEFELCPLTAKNPLTKTDEHYAVLSLLLELSNCPTESYKPPARECVTEPEFDWSGYLLEGEDRLRSRYSDDSDEWDPEEEEDPNKTLQSEEGDSSVNQDSSRLIGSLNETRDWLSRNLMVRYWENEGREGAVIGRFPVSNLHRNWDENEKRLNPFHVSRKSFLTEIQLIRETLWMLFGVKESFAYNFDGRRYSLNKDVYLSHLTNETLETTLSKLMKHGNQMAALNTFCDDVLKQRRDKTDLTLVTQTYEALVSTLLDFIADYQRAITRQETAVRNQEVPMTLSILSDDLGPWFNKLDLVYSIYISGVAAAAELDNNIRKVSYLLNVMFRLLIEFDTIGIDDGKDQKNLLLLMWIQTCRPYLTILSDWISLGNLIDPREEFLIQRNKELQSLDESFWEQGFLLREESGPSLDSGKVGEDIDVSDATMIPRFLRPVLREMVLTGKSMEVLVGMNQVERVVKFDGIEYKEKRLYEIFVENLSRAFSIKAEVEEKVKSQEGDITEENKEEEETTLKKGQTTHCGRDIEQHLNVNEEKSEQEKTTLKKGQTIQYGKDIAEHLNVDGVYDPMLKINFESVFDPIPNQLSSDVDNTESDSRLLRSLDLDILGPLEMVLQQSLYPHIQSRYTEVCTELVSIVKNDYHLFDELKAMRRFFLMEEGDVLFDFYSMLFNRINRGEEWREDSILNFILEEALETKFPQLDHRLSITVAPPSTKDRSPIALTDCIKLHYKVAWPVSMVISEKYQKRYNEIFSFILQIKRAKYCLEQCSFKVLERNTIQLDRTSDLQSSNDDLPTKVKVHSIQIFRYRLLYFVNSIHDHIMTRILHSRGLEFEKDLQKARDLDAIIQTHVVYLEKIYHHCLLDEGVAMLKSAITMVLNHTLLLSHRWQSDVHQITSASLEEMETEFSHCVQFLGSFLSSTVKHGTFPHLESLAFAMVNLHGQH